MKISTFHTTGRVRYLALFGLLFLLVYSTPLRPQGGEPEICIGDLNFGTFDVGVDGPKRLSLVICNIGGGELTFDNPNDLDPARLLEWLDRNNFVVDRAEIERLKDLRLKGGECDSIIVTFTPNTVGVFITTARLWGSTRTKRDTSVWRAIVVKPGPLISSYDWKERWVTRKDTGNCTKNGTPEYYANIMLSNTGTSDFTVKSIELIDQDAVDGYFRFDNSDPLKVIRVGDNLIAGAPPRVQRVAFAPKDERVYFTRVRVTTDRDEEVISMLIGIGIESHGEISSITWPDALYQGTADPGRTLYATLRALPTRPLTVTDIVIDGPHAADFTVDRANVTFPMTLLPNQTADIPVIFKPTAPGKRDAFIHFVGDHSLCDDSTVMLVGTTVVSSGVDAEAMPETVSMRVRSIDPQRYEITFTLPRSMNVRAEIYDALGRRIATLADDVREAGRHALQWDASIYPSGVYYCRMEGEDWMRAMPLVVR